jgi:ribosomal protein S20
MRGSARKYEHNSFWKRRISSSEKNILKLISGGAGADILKESFSALQKVLDKAVKEQVIKRGKAARIKSRIAKKLTANAKPSTKPRTKSARAKSKES